MPSSQSVPGAPAPKAPDLKEPVKPRQPLPPKDDQRQPEVRTVAGAEEKVKGNGRGQRGLARLASRRLPELHLIANPVEFPAVAKGKARFRMQVMANHTLEDVSLAARRVRLAHEQASADQ